MSKKKNLAELEERVTVLENEKQAARQRRQQVSQILFNTAGAVLAGVVAEVAASPLTAFLWG